MSRDDAVRFESHLGRPVLRTDLRHCHEDEFLVRLGWAERYVDARLRPYCVLWDITGSTLTREISRATKALAVRIREQRLSTGSATIGVCGLKRVMARAVEPHMYWATDVEDALRWLTRSERWRDAATPGH